MERPIDLKSWLSWPQGTLREQVGEMLFRLNWLLARVMAFSLCMPDIWVCNCFFFWALTWFWEALVNGRLLHPRFDRRHIVLYLMVLFYVVMLISLLYTDNLHYSKRMLERRVSFIVLMLMAIFRLHPDYRLKPLLTAFVAGAACHLTLMLAWPVLHYLSDFGFRNYLHQFPSAYVVSMLAYKHRAFFGIIQLMAWLTFYAAFRQKRLPDRLQKRSWLLFCSYSLLLMAWCILSQGRLNLILAILLLFWMLIDLSREYARKYRLAIVSLLGLALIVVGLVWHYHPAFDRIQPDQLKKQDNEQLQEGRIGIWTAAVDVLREDHIWLTGAGVGDAKDLLMAKYKDLHLADDIIANRSHAHNTFLHTALESGLSAVLIWTAILLLPLLLCTRQQRPLLLAATLCWLLLMMTETVTMQAGGFITFALMQFVWAMTDYGRQESASCQENSRWMENKVVCRIWAVLFSVAALSVILTVLFLCCGPRGHDPRRPQTYAVKPYTLARELPGQVPAELQGCQGYQITHISKGYDMPDINAVDFNTGFCLRDTTKHCFSAWCYVSRDFNGRAVMLRTSSYADIYRYTALYDLNRPDTWQKLEIRFDEIDPSVPFTLFFRLPHAHGDLSSMTGYVIFALPQFED